MFSKVSFSVFNGPHGNLVQWFHYPEIQDGARKPEVVLFWHVWLHLKDIWVDCYVYSCRQIECHYCYLDHNPQFTLMSHFKMAAEKYHNHTKSEIVDTQTQ